MALHFAEFVAVGIESEQRSLALEQLALSLIQAGFAGRPGAGKCVDQGIGKPRIGIETIGSQLQAMDRWIDLGFLKPRDDRLGISQRLAEIRKAFQSAADHLVAPNREKNP